MVTSYGPPLARGGIVTLLPLRGTKRLPTGGLTPPVPPAAGDRWFCLAVALGEMWFGIVCVADQDVEHVVEDDLYIGSQ